MPNADGPQTSAKYQPTAAENAQIERAFTYHPPKGDQAERYQIIRDAAKHFADVVLCNAPPGRERALSMTQLEQSIMWANAAIARGE